LRYGLAFVAVAATFGLRVVLTTWVGPGLPTYITFYPAVMVAALLGGFGPGLLATALAGLLVAYWILPPEGFAIASPVERLGVVLFSGMGLFMSAVAELYRRNRLKAAAYDREMALRETRREKEFLTDVLEHASQPFAVGYPDGRLGMCNRAYERLTGYSAKELHGLDWTTTLTPPEWRELEHQKLEDLHRTGQPVRYEKEYLRKDGTRVPIELLVHLAKDADGRPEYYYSFLTDITERKRAEDALRKANEGLEQRVAERTAELQEKSRYTRSLLEASLDPLVTISREGKITDVNRATELITGASRGKLIGSNFADYFTDPVKANAGYQKVVAAGLVRDYPLTVRHADGHTTDVLYNAVVYRNEAGEVQGVFAAAHDISERKRMEAGHLELLRRLKDAEETERSRISRELHDRLGQDLTGLKLGLQFIRKQGPFTPPVQQSVGRLEQLTDGLMRDVHRLAWELHPAALDDLGLEAVLRQFATQWSETNKIPVDFHSNGVDTKRLPIQVETTLYRITQEALTNVTRHARAKRVSVLLERRPIYVSLIIEDDGRGFDATKQVPTAQGKLGLLGMKERVTLAGGTFEVESAPNAGTTVFVRVPLKPKTAES
jgi:PAS domain S-box-containing protein